MEFSEHKNHINERVCLSRHAFRLLFAILAIWLTLATIFLYRQELEIKFGIWDDFSLNSNNYSKFGDARDSEEVFQDQLILTQQRYRSGSLFIGPISLYSRKMHRIDNTATYKMSLDVMAISDGKDDVGSSIFAGVLFYDKNKELIAEPKSHMFGVAWNHMVKKTDGMVNLSGYFSRGREGLNGIPNNAYYFKLAIDLNYADPKAVVILSNIKFTKSTAR